MNIEIFQNDVYINEVRLSSISHIEDILKDYRFWVVEKWTKNIQLNNISTYDLMNILKKHFNK